MPAVTFNQVRRAAARVRDPEQAVVTYGLEASLGSHASAVSIRYFPRVKRKYEKRDAEYWARYKEPPEPPEWVRGKRSDLWRYSV